MGVRTAGQIRREFIEFFQGKGHTAVPSAPVVPADDQTLMFTNAGMNQFKDVFLGTGSRPYNRAVDTQKCIRVSGKHNDLDDVGHDTYHHTFFEMLGNWSFGDYFKREVIGWAWELLTEVWGIDKRRLHATYFQGDQAEGLEPDSEARDLWTSVTDIDPAHIHPGDKKDNFWEMGDTGPCGPCSEIHIDLTPDCSGGPLVNAGDHRVIEIWNLVFIQYNRASDGKLPPLPARHVDTGMGFERIVALLQGMDSGRLGQITNYDTDIFSPIFAGIREVTGAPAYTGLLEGPVAGAPGSDPGVEVEQGEGQSPKRERGGSTADVMKDIAYRVIADHARMLTFAITDGATPSNEGRGYVVRRILRRAAHFGREHLGEPEPFIYKLVPTIVGTMGGAFPELKDRANHVADLIRDEEESFGRTLDLGLRVFEVCAKEAETKTDEAYDLACIESGETRPDRAAAAAGCDDSGMVGYPPFPGKSRAVRAQPVISGRDAFELHDTHGFPIDLTEIKARERGMTVDIEEYERLMDEARERSRSTDDTTQGLAVVSASIGMAGLAPTDDSHKYYSEQMTATVQFVAILESADDPPAAGIDPPASATEGQQASVVLDATCFYAEQGGQVGDEGEMVAPGVRFRVGQTARKDRVVVHIGTVVEGTLSKGQPVKLVVSSRRGATMQNHTATHVLNWALREVLEIGGGGKVEQKGSLVDPDKTRFDFSHTKPLTPQEIEQVEALCNEQIRADRPVYTKEVPEAEARKINTLRAVFGEKYPEVVRVVSTGADIDAMLADPQNPEWMKYPVEFCGGTHVKHSGEIGAFVLTAEESVAKGIRRVVGITGETARRAIETGRQLIERAAQIKSGPADQLAGGLAELQKTMADAEIPIRDRIALRQAIADLQKTVKQRSKQQAIESAGLVKSARRKLLDKADRVGGSAIIVGELPDVPVEQIREAADWFRSQAGSAAVCLAVLSDGKPMLIAAMTDDLVKKGLKAGDLIKHIVPAIDGRGGGKPTLAQAGGNKPEGVPEALEAAAGWIRQKLA